MSTNYDLDGLTVTADQIRDAFRAGTISTAVLLEWIQGYVRDLEKKVKSYASGENYVCAYCGADSPRNENEAEAHAKSCKEHPAWRVAERAIDLLDEIVLVAGNSARRCVTSQYLAACVEPEIASIKRSVP